MPQKSQTELIAQIASGIPEHELSLPNEPVVEAAMRDKTEQRAIRLLAIAAKSIHDLEPHHQEEIAHLSYLVASRGRAWNRAAARFQKKTEAMIQESARVQKLANDLAEVALRIAELNEDEE